MTRNVITLVFALAIPSVALAEDALVTPNGTSYAFDGTDQTITILYTTAPGVAKLQVTVVDAAFEARHDQVAVTGTSEKPTITADGDGGTLNLHARKCSAPGTYSVWLDLATDTRTQRLKVDLVHPPAVVRAVPAAVIIETSVVWPCSTPSLPARSIEIYETSGKSAATISGVDTDLARHAGDPSESALELTIAAPIAAGGSGSASLAAVPTRPFSAGTTTGVIELRAPQLATAVPITYEVRAKLCLVPIAIFIVLGLVLGFGGKSLVRRLVARGATRRAIRDVNAAAIAASLATSDATATTELRDVSNQCAHALDRVRLWSSGAPTDPGSPQSLRKALDAVLARLVQRLATARTDVASLSDAVTPAYALPQSLREPVREIRRGVAVATEQLHNGNAAAAQGAVAEARSSIEAMAEPAASWSEVVAEIATSLDARPGGAAWPVITRTGASAIAQRARGLATRLSEKRIGARDDDLAERLLAIHALELHLRESAKRIAQLWEIALAEVRTELDGITGNPGARLHLRDNGDGDATEYLRTRLFPETSAVVGEMGDIANQISAAMRPGIEAAIRDGKWTAAAREIALELNPPPGGGIRGAFDALEPTAPELDAEQRRQLVPESIAAIALPDARGVASASPELATRLATTGLSIATMVVVLFVYYSSQSLSTWSDLFGVFLKAASIDVGLDAFVNAVKALVKA